MADFSLRIVVVIAALFGLFADVAAAVDPAAWSAVKPLMVKYCLDCHDGDQPDGDFGLRSLRLDFTGGASAGRWIEVMDNLNASLMPPPDEAQPTPSERVLITDWIAAELTQARRAASNTGGRALLRRLSRTEYENTVRDLLEVVFEPNQNPLTLLPPDGAVDGF